jgi:hypothetical protein
MRRRSVPEAMLEGGTKTERGMLANSCKTNRGVRTMPNAMNAEFKMQGVQWKPVPVHTGTMRASRELGERAAVERGGTDD